MHLRVVAAAVLLALAACQSKTSKTADEPLGAVAVPATALTPLSHDTRAPWRWLIIGGGPTPEANQVSIEQDVALALATVRGSGQLLFAAGPAGDGVQVVDKPPRGEPLLSALAELFAPRGGRDGHYRKTVLPADGAASRERVLGTLAQALDQKGSPLLLYVDGHGSPGDAATGNGIELWGQASLTVHDLAAALDQKPERPVRLVIATCFSGGFAELAFLGGDSHRGPSPAERCGLFSTTWDLEASGCDPDPDRGGQDGYTLYFLQALAGRDRDGKPVPLATLDLDGDGRISLLEAHTYVRIASSAPDVPTTTSERWLRQVVPHVAPALRPLEEPEEQAVVAAFSGPLDYQGDPAALRRRYDELEAKAQAANEELHVAEEHEDEAARQAGAALLARWPTLDDPWHPDFSPTISREHDAIARFLETSPAYLTYERAREATLEADEAHWSLRREAAPYERLLRALDNENLAAQLKRRGGRDWRVYERLRACERWVP
jgi:hypothetical protein